MNDDRFRREDDRYLDFEDVTNGSIVLIDKTRELTNYVSGYSRVRFVEGDIWIVVELTGRPRVATLRNLQRHTHANIRVDELLSLDDKGVVTIGPGPFRAFGSD